PSERRVILDNKRWGQVARVRLFWWFSLGKVWRAERARATRNTPPASAESAMVKANTGGLRPKWFQFGTNGITSPGLADFARRSAQTPVKMPNAPPIRASRI